MKNTEVKPITITDSETGTKYVLEFNRESVMFAERSGFAIEDVDRYPMSKIPEFFYYAFRMHHKNVSREKTDRILFEGLGGMPDGMLRRLGELYGAPFEAFKVDDEGEAKNSKMTVEF